MKGQRYTEEQNIDTLKEHEAGAGKPASPYSLFSQASRHKMPLLSHLVAGSEIGA
jgi:hypothetical protein